MPFICYDSYRPKERQSEMIDQANEIINEYQAQGLTMTLRQLYYQFVARDLMANEPENYQKLIKVISKARLGGLVDWDAIEDRLRDLVKNSHWDSPQDIIQTCANQYRINKWLGQDYQPEVWIEKAALIGVIDNACRDLDIPFFASRGYNSQSEMYRAGQRLVGYIDDDDQIPVILYFGDHDPSGIQMSADIEGRLRMYVEHHTSRHDIIVRRVALTIDQVEEYQPPNNVAKQTDSRYRDYAAQYGDDCWELDALEPSVLVGLVRTAVEGYRNERRWRAAVRRERAERSQLVEVSRRWNAITNFLENQDEEDDLVEGDDE